MKKYKTVWVNGCFDILHVGHMHLFKYAAELGDRVIVGIDSDSRVKELKGDSRPINDEVDRMEMLQHITHIDIVTIFSNEHELISHLKDYNVDAIIIGDDYKDKRVVGSEEVSEVIFMEKINGYSTTNIIKSIDK